MKLLRKFLDFCLGFLFGKTVDAADQLQVFLCGQVGRNGSFLGRNTNGGFYLPILFRDAVSA